MTKEEKCLLIMTAAKLNGRRTKTTDISLLTGVGGRQPPCLQIKSKKVEFLVIMFKKTPKVNIFVLLKILCFRQAIWNLYGIYGVDKKRVGVLNLSSEFPENDRRLIQILSHPLYLFEI